VKTARFVFNKAMGVVRGPADAAPPAKPPDPAGAPPAAEGYDQIEVPTRDGGIHRLTRAEFEALDLPARVALLMGGKMRFFRNGQHVSAREALRGR